MLMLSTTAAQSKGQLRTDAGFFCRQAISMFQSRVIGHDFSDRAFIPSKDMPLILSWAKAFVAMKWFKNEDLPVTSGWLETIRTRISEFANTGLDPAKKLENMRNFSSNIHLSRCDNCTYENESNQCFCKYCGWVLQNKIPNYREICSSLSNGHILAELESIQDQHAAAENSIHIVDAFKQYVQIYPYATSDILGAPIFKMQCHCIAQLILVMSNFGRHNLNKNDLLLEWTFCHSEIGAVIEMEDVELVGKFISCLLIMGADEASPEICRGRIFLRNMEAWFGNTGRWTDTNVDIDCHYRTSWFASVALMQRMSNLDESIYLKTWKSILKPYQLVSLYQDIKNSKQPQAIDLAGTKELAVSKSGCASDAVNANAHPTASKSSITIENKAMIDSGLGLQLKKCHLHSVNKQ